MNIIEKITVNGFWGVKDIEINLNRDINFLIGSNGSGKTTLINMIAAALNADFKTLDRLNFDKISILLNEFGGRKKPSIIITKTPRDTVPFPEIKFLIKDKASDSPLEYSLDNYEEQRTYREYSAVSRIRGKRIRVSRDLIEHLHRLVNVSWLSIHRAEPTKTPFEDKSYESTVDKKLNDLSNILTRYLAQFDRQSDVEASVFQQNVFLSLVTVQTFDELYIAMMSMDINNERSILTDILRKFHIDDDTIFRTTKDHFDVTKKAVDNLRKSTKEMEMPDAIALISHLRVHLVVQEWNKLIQKQEIIFAPRETFLNTLNRLLNRKQLEINDKNEFVAIMENDNRFELNQLSSGEKQLFILLGEALVQNKQPWIYIADEPELSLHVDWQSKLINSLRAVNPNAQILCATHSPDIVAEYDSKVFDMEKLIA